MKHFIYITALVIIVSCTHHDQPSPVAASLKGTWITHVDSPGVQLRTIFAFSDSLCSINSNLFSYSPYSINDSLLNINYHAADSALSSIVSYKILRLAGDSLSLQQVISNGKTKSPVTLFRIKEKNTITPSKIYFISSSCLGTCPAMYVAIDNNQNMRFNGQAFTNLKDGYSGRINNNIYSTLQQLIKYLPVDSLKEFYEAQWTDDQTAGIALVTGNKEIVSVVYGNDKEPFELRLLLDYLMELYHHVDLQKDSSFNEQYLFTDPTFSKLRTIGAPPPPPYIPAGK